jgi:indole-3-glycerol phosphate synthase
MRDFLDTLACAAKASVNEAYYEDTISAAAVSASLRNAIRKSVTAAVIAEVKGASPSRKVIRKSFCPGRVAEAMARGGAAGVSVITEPKYFRGSLGYLAEIREAVSLPLLMKDIVVSPVQLGAAAKVGANAVLLIQALFDRGHCEQDIEEMIAGAHRKNLEVLLETHNEKEFRSGLESEADLIGINNRNLGTLEVDLTLTRKLLANSDCRDKIVVSESGIESPADIRFLSKCGAAAFLVGSAIMLSADIEQKVRELVETL